MFFSKGSTMIYAGQERMDNNLPSLFDRDLVNYSGKDISELIKKLAQITKDKTFSYGFHNIVNTKKDIYLGSYDYLDKKLIGIFNVGLETGMLDVDFEDGTYVNLINEKQVVIKDKKIELSTEPMILKVIKWDI